MKRVTGLIVGLIFFGVSNSVWAAACCGGNQMVPSLMTADYGAQASFTTSLGAVVGDAPARDIPVFRSPSDKESIRSYRLEGAWHIEEMLQMGGSVAFFQRERTRDGANSSSSGLGDISLDVAYEPWEFSRGEGYIKTRRQKVLVFSDLLVPSGKSIYEATDRFSTDAHGKGYFSLGGGALWELVDRQWDYSSMLELHHGFDANHTSATGDRVNVRPGWGAMAAAGVGYSPAKIKLRVGAQLQYRTEESMIVNSTMTDSMYVWDSVLQSSYSFENEWMALASYSDQTLMGPAKNTSLARTISLGLRYHMF